MAEALSALVPRHVVAGGLVASDPGDVAVGHGPVGWNRRPVCRSRGHRVHACWEEQGIGEEKDTTSFELNEMNS